MDDHDYRQAQYERLRRLQEFSDLQAVQLTRLGAHVEEQADTIAGLRDDLETAQQRSDRFEVIAREHEAKAVTLILQLNDCRKSYDLFRKLAGHAAAGSPGPDCSCGLCKPTILPFPGPKATTSEEAP